jgi:hypothetical protein
MQTRAFLRLDRRIFSLATLPDTQLFHVFFGSFPSQPFLVVQHPFKLFTVKLRHCHSVKLGKYNAAS